MKDFNLILRSIILSYKFRSFSFIITCKQMYIGVYIINNCLDFFYINYIFLQ